MSRLPDPGPSIYRSRVDPWIGCVIVLSFAAGTVASVQLLRGGSTGNQVMGVVTLLILGAVGSVIVPVRYHITERELVIRSGVYRVRVVLGAIERVVPGRSALASPALSMDRLSVHYRTGRFTAPRIQISPESPAAFLAELAAAAGLHLEGDRLVRWAQPDELAGGLAAPSGQPGSW